MIYRYVGAGTGVPGLPHEITDEQAKELNVSALLKQAIENGSYQAVDDIPATKTNARSE